MVYQGSEDERRGETHQWGELAVFPQRVAAFMIGQPEVALPILITDESISRQAPENCEMPIADAIVLARAVAFAVPEPALRVFDK